MKYFYEVTACTWHFEVQYIVKKDITTSNIMGEQGRRRNGTSGYCQNFSGPLNRTNTCFISQINIREENGSMC